VSEPEREQRDFPITFPDGTVRALSDWAGAPVLLVNVASKCGFTPQYEGLEKLHRNGLAVVGFPCNQFGGQEPGTDAEIATFCSATYDVTFPIAAKVDVNGPAADPLWVWLRQQAPGSLGPDNPLRQYLSPEVADSDQVKWNFTKFLLDGSGRVVRRYEPTDTPESIAADL
jgi:glutathione peroxidase